MRKILYLSTYSETDVGAFSGTNKRIYDALVDTGCYQVDYYCAVPNPLIRFFYRSIGFLCRTLLHVSFQTGLNEFLYPSICRRTLNHLRRRDYDAIVCWQICFGGVFAKYAGKKVFFSDSTYHRIVPYYGWRVSQSQFRRVDYSQRQLLQKCDQFWCFSSYFVSDATDYYRISKNKIRLFRFFSTLPLFSSPREPNLNLMVLLVGTNYKDKGVPIAIETVRLLNEKYNLPAFLNVVGISEHDGAPSKYVAYHGVVSQFSEPKKFALFFQQSDLFLMPTLHECAGIVFSEAASCGLPSVSYNTGGVRDYVEDGVSGYLLPEKSTPDEFARLIMLKLSNPSHREKMALSARAYYKKHLCRTLFIKDATLSLNELW